MLKKGDYILFIIIIIILISYFGYNTLMVNNQKEDKIAIIKYNGKIINEVNLSEVSEPYEITIDKEFKNIIYIENGRIKYIESNCRNNTCVKHGWLHNVNDTAACLPNKTSITIISNEKPKLDGVSY